MTMIFGECCALHKLCGGWDPNNGAGYKKNWAQIVSLWGAGLLLIIKYDIVSVNLCFPIHSSAKININLPLKSKIFILSQLEDYISH